jgi:hypothetical protein
VVVPVGVMVLVTVDLHQVELVAAVPVVHLHRVWPELLDQQTQAVVVVLVVDTSR